MISDTQSLVFKAADELLQEGRRPTQQSVRERIGQGSVTTINKALNRWWAELGERVQGRRRMPDLPEPVENAITSLWQLALSHAQHGVDQLRQEAAAKLRQEREQLDQDRKLQQQTLATNQEKLERAFDRIDALQQQLEVLRDHGRQAEQDALAQERRQLAAEREWRSLEAENRKLTESMHQAERENKNLTNENKMLKDELDAMRNSGATGDQCLLEENRNLRTALNQSDLRFAEQRDEVERLRRALKDDDTRAGG